MSNPAVIVGSDHGRVTHTIMSRDRAALTVEMSPEAAMVTAIDTYLAALHAPLDEIERQIAELKQDVERVKVR